MIHAQSGFAVIPEHSHLGLPYSGKIVPQGVDPRIVCHIRNIAEQIDGNRNSNEEQNTPQGNTDQAGNNPIAGTAVRKQRGSLFFRKTGGLKEAVQ